MTLLVLLLLFGVGHFGMELIIHLSLKWRAWVLRRVEAEIARYPVPPRAYVMSESGERRTLH